jgi:hypothetical protein
MAILVWCNVVLAKDRTRKVGKAPISGAFCFIDKMEHDSEITDSASQA